MVSGDQQPTNTSNWLLACLQGWLLLAALGQLVYLAGWPLYVLEVHLPEVWAWPVAIVRLGFYTALAQGIAQGSRAAWAGTLLELVRAFLFFAAAALLREGSQYGALYPAGWAQGVLGGALPMVVGVDTALALGWSPHREWLRQVRVAPNALAALAGFAALWLRRQEGAFSGAPAGGHPAWSTILIEGLPASGSLCLLELLARGASG